MLLLGFWNLLFVSIHFLNQRWKTQTTYTIPTHVQNPERYSEQHDLRRCRGDCSMAHGSCPGGNCKMAFLPQLPLFPLLLTQRCLLTFRPGTLNIFYHRNKALHYSGQLGMDKIILTVRPFMSLGVKVGFGELDGNAIYL